jgi:exopolysaccharide biosynthesis protein
MQVLFYFIITLLILFRPPALSAQLKWVNVDSLYQPLPSTVHVYRTTDSLEGKPNIAYYVSAELKDRYLDFTADTTYKRRLTPKQFYEKNDKPLLVVNCTFFSFETNQNLNVVVKDGKLVSYNIHSAPGKGKDTLQYWHFFRSAIGINKKRKADIAWLYTDSTDRFAHPFQSSFPKFKSSIPNVGFKKSFTDTISGQAVTGKNIIPDWKMQTAVGGGPVLLQNGEIKITNEEEMMFAGKAINDKHPRTAMGYTKDGKLIILLIQGRYPGIAEGATLIQEAQLFKDLGCWEALNLDGGGSSCMLVNGKETIKPSSDGVQRPVPAVFLIKEKL